MTLSSNDGMKVNDRLMCLSTSTSPNEYDENNSAERIIKRNDSDEVREGVKESEKGVKICSINLTKGKKYYVSATVRQEGGDNDYSDDK